MEYQEQEQIWEATWARQNRTYQEYMADHPKKRMVDVLKEHGNLSGSHVLDIGTGEGFWLRYYVEHGAASATGIDITRSSVMAAARHAAQAYVAQADTRALPFATDTFDLVLSSGVVEHFPETLLAVQEHVRVTKPGGKVIVAIPNRFGFRHVELYSRIAAYGGFMHKHYSADEAYNLFHLVRLSDIRITGIDARLPRWGGKIERYVNALLKRMLDPLMLRLERRSRWARFHANLHVLIGTKPESWEGTEKA